MQPEVLFVTRTTSLACGDDSHWNLARGELLQEDDSRSVSQSQRKVFGVYLPVEARLFHWSWQSRWGNNRNNPPCEILGNHFQIWKKKRNSPISEDSVCQNVLILLCCSSSVQMLSLVRRRLYFMLESVTFALAFGRRGKLEFLCHFTRVRKYSQKKWIRSMVSF